MEITVGKGIIVFAVGFVILALGILINKGIGIVGAGVIVSFIGFGICLLAMVLVVLSWLIKLLRNSK